MLEAAEKLEFEKAAEIRDQIAELQEMPEIGQGKTKVKRSGKRKNART